MIFSSWQFISLFLPATLAGFFLVPSRLRAARKAWLLLASLVFYGFWKLEYVPLMVLSIGFNYAVSETLVRWRGRRGRDGLVVLGVAANLALLGYYKYAGFLAQTLGWVTHRDLGHFQILLPLAISFFTFTQIAYLVDVYRDESRHHRFLDYALFVVLFPHLIAGPIVRHWEIIPQFADRDLRPSRTDLGVGSALFLMGLFKKVLLADAVAGPANLIYGAAAGGGTLTWFDAWFGTLAYALQIYFDFSGYSDMAIGLARLFGIRFPMNFFSPYQAGSITEFWSRWHITLTRFLREYVYFPLGGNRCGPGRHARNILFTMLLSGLWHGAGWTFIVWGGLHGVGLVVAHRWKQLRERRGWAWERHRIYRGAMMGLTFLVVVLGWVLFRANDFSTAGRVFASLFGLHGFTVPFGVGEAQLGLGRAASALGAVIVNTPVPGLSYRFQLHLITILLAVVWFAPNSQQWLAAYEPILEKLKTPSRWSLRLGPTAGIVLGLGFFLVIRSFFAGPAPPFLYFNF
jgi:alginate O-acetyltransferase complex protein AlgI